MKYDLYLDNPVDQETVPGTKGIKYTYGSDHLSIFVSGKLTHEVDGLRPGMYELYNSCGTQSVHRKALPRDDRHLLAWILSFDRSMRTRYLNDYKSHIESACQEHIWRGCCVQELKVENLLFAVLVNPQISSFHARAAAYLPPEQKVTKNMVIKVLQEFILGIRYPRPFVYRVLQARFGFTDNDLRELESWEATNREQIFQKDRRRPVAMTQTAPFQAYNLPDSRSSANIPGADL